MIDDLFLLLLVADEFARIGIVAGRDGSVVKKFSKLTKQLIDMACKQLQTSNSMILETLIV